jgi:YD repeat-containing protein
MGDTIFSAPWRLSIKKREAWSARFLLCVVPGSFKVRPRRNRALLYPLIVFLCLFSLVTVGLPLPVLSAQLSAREEDGLVGAVHSVETIDSLLAQTDRYDPQGRILERIQDGKDASQGLWPLRFTYVYDQEGKRLAEVVRDARGELVKETRSVYDAQGNRSAELAAWGDGTFENVSLYAYDESRRLRRGLHYNAVQVVNRNLYSYDAAGRLAHERLERNYRYDAAGHQVVTTHRFDVGHDVAITYDDRGHVQEKVVSDLRGRKQGHSEFRYDERGSQIEERSYDAGGRLTDRKTYRYIYDTVGNWITETFEWWEVQKGEVRLKQSHVRERRITYY